MTKESIYKLLPNFLQNSLVTLFDIIQYRKRHGYEYYKFKKTIKKFESKSLNEIQDYQNELLIEFLVYCKLKSPYYQEKLKDIDVSKGIDILKEIPICSKEEFTLNIPKIVNGNIKEMSISKTGGTTGSSMQVYYRWDDIQKRFAFLDNFRERFGYTFGAKTAWFSGKDILVTRDIKNNVFWKQDWLHNIRYYSTYHIKESYLLFYINDLKKYKPQFIVGFPSSIVEIARYGLNNNLQLGYNLKAIFPTAETKNLEESKDMMAFFGCGVYDQYSSSEGAPFITECEYNSLHFDSLSGIIEIVDENNNPSIEGRMLITAFQTRGTPLIRYDIGDTMKWSEKKNCECGRNTPIVEELQGRINDFIYSEETGKCNLGNISNCVKNVKGIIKFQVLQEEVNKITVKVNKTNNYTKKDEEVFLEELRFRLGHQMGIEFLYVEDIPREKSGKFRIVKNLIKNTINIESDK